MFRVYVNVFTRVCFSCFSSSSFLVFLFAPRFIIILFLPLLHFLPLLLFPFSFIRRILIRRFNCSFSISVLCPCFSLFLAVSFSPCFLPYFTLFIYFFFIFIFLYIYIYFFLNLYFVRPNLHLHTTKLSRVSKNTNKPFTFFF